MDMHEIVFKLKINIQTTSQTSWKLFRQPAIHRNSYWARWVIQTKCMQPLSSKYLLRTSSWFFILFFHYACTHVPLFAQQVVRENRGTPGSTPSLFWARFLKFLLIDFFLIKNTKFCVLLLSILKLKIFNNWFIKINYKWMIHRFISDVPIEFQDNLSATSFFRFLFSCVIL